MPSLLKTPNCKKMVNTEKVYPPSMNVLFSNTKQTIYT